MRKLLTRRRVQPYKVIVADPAWKFGDALPGKKRGALSHYDTMAIAKIKAYPLPPIADDAMLFLWRVSSMQREALDVVEAWGFELKTEIVWVKTTAHVESPDGEFFVDDGSSHHVSDGDGNDVKGPNVHVLKLAYGMGRYARGAHETCLVARRGKFKVADAGARSVFFAPRREHSRKPNEFYDIVDRMVGADTGPRLDLFAGEPREKYTAFGELGRMARHAGSSTT